MRAVLRRIRPPRPSTAPPGLTSRSCAARWPIWPAKWKKLASGGSPLFWWAVPWLLPQRSRACTTALFPTATATACPTRPSSAPAPSMPPARRAWPRRVRWPPHWHRATPPLPWSSPPARPMTSSPPRNPWPTWPLPWLMPCPDSMPTSSWARPVRPCPCCLPPPGTLPSSAAPRARRTSFQKP